LRQPELSQHPVLHHFEVKRLAVFMTRDFPQLDAGRSLLAYRYHDIYPGHPLTHELDWARSIVAAVDKLLDGWAAPHSFLAKEALRGLLRYHETDRDPALRLLAKPPNDEENGPENPEVGKSV
jgi:hypothetical protein